MVEIIPIENERANQKLPIHLEVSPDSFPERFQIRLDWNFIAEKWVMEVYHVSLDRTVLKSMVTPFHPYWYEPYIVFTFIDPSGNNHEVTPSNLGDEVKLYAYPGPAGQEDPL